MTQERLEQIIELLKKNSGPAFSEKAKNTHNADRISLVTEGLQHLVKELELARKKTEVLEKKLNKAALSQSSGHLASAREKRSQERLALFASIVSLSDDAIISKDLDGNITSWNNAAEKIFGYAAEEIIGRNISLLIPSYLHDEEKNIIEKIRKGELVRHYETERVRKDGTIIHVSLTISPVKDLQGNITGASKILRDITHERQVEAQLRTSENEYRSLMEQASDGIFISDQEGRYCDVNLSACKMLGYTKEELLSKSAYDIVEPGDLENNPINFEGLKAGKIFLTIRQLRRKDGSTLYVESNSKMLSNGKLLGIARDITERKEAERKEKEHLEDLEEMMFMTSHKVRQPVAHILGISHLLEIAACSEPELKKIAAIMKNSAVALDNFTRELSDFIHGQGLKAKDGQKEEEGTGDEV